MRNISLKCSYSWSNKHYAKFKKCKLFTTQVIFLGYVVSGEGIQVDESNIEAKS